MAYSKYNNGRPTCDSFIGTPAELVIEYLFIKLVNTYCSIDRFSLLVFGHNNTTSKSNNACVSRPVIFRNMSRLLVTRPYVNS